MQLLSVYVDRVINWLLHGAKGNWSMQLSSLEDRQFLKACLLNKNH